jgi:hypothetical protein
MLISELIKYHFQWPFTLLCSAVIFSRSPNLTFDLKFLKMWHINFLWGKYIMCTNYYLKQLSISNWDCNRFGFCEAFYRGVISPVLMRQLRATGPLHGAQELPAPQCSISSRNLFEVESLFSFRSRGPVFLFLVPILVPQVMGNWWSPPATPHMDGRHIYNGVLPGAPRGLFTTLVINHPSATQPSAQCLTPWLRWLVLSRMHPHETPEPNVHVRGEGGIPYGEWGCDSGYHAIVTRQKPQDDVTPKGDNLPLIPTPPHGLVKPFLECWAQRLAVPKWYSRETTQVAKATPIRVFSRIRPRQTTVIPESHDAAAWEAPVVKTPLAFLGT